MAQEAAQRTRKALGTYLNDHLAGSTMGRDLARQL